MARGAEPLRDHRLVMAAGVPDDREPDQHVGRHARRGHAERRARHPGELEAADDPLGERAAQHAVDAADQVELRRRKPPRETGGEVDLDIERDAGMALAHVQQQLRQPCHRDAVGDAELHMAGQLRRIGGRDAQLMRVLEQAAGADFEMPPARGQAAGARGALDQARTDAALEFGDALGDRRLGQVEARGRGTEAAELRDQEERLEVAQAKIEGGHWR
jgi:hypothetical protein